MAEDLAKKRGLPLIVISAGETKIVRVVEPVGEYVVNPKARAAIVKQRLAGKQPNS